MILPFPDPPAQNLVVKQPPQPLAQSIDSILAASMISSPNLPPPTTQSMGGTVGPKESQPIPKFQQPEHTVLVEIQEEEKLPVEIEGYLQKLDQAGEIKLPEPITHDGEVLLADTDAQVVKERIVLPLSQSGYQQSKKSPVSDSARWLAEWCLRLIKMMKDKVKYADG